MKGDRLSIFMMSALLVTTSPLLAATSPATVVRAAIDIGMGGPKLQVAEVDPTTHKVVSLLHTQRYFVNFYHDLSQSADNTLSSAIMEQGLQAFNDAVNAARSFNVEGVAAVATAAFRAASNGDLFADKLQADAGVPVHIIDQELEGKLAFQAVISKLDVDAENLVVWDIGGGSIQFVGTKPDGSYVVDCADYGVGAFKDYIIEVIQQRDIKYSYSPNPMSSDDVFKAEARARELSTGINAELKGKLADPTTIVVGAGSVFGYGIAGLLQHKTPFTIDDLTTVVQSLPGKTDVDLGGGDFACVEGSNAILVLGFMQNLHIGELRIININNADGALTYTPFWK